MTFLFTDIESSTRLWEESPSEMASALEWHDRVLADAIASHGGHVFKGVGDGLYAVFDSPLGAVHAAIGAQLVLAEQAAGRLALRVRMAIHLGEALARDGDYFGPVLNRTARLLGVAHGGQILLSGVVRDRLADSFPPDHLLDLGQHRLRDLQSAETVYQVCHPGLPIEFPALRSLDQLPHNLPQQYSSFVGRTREAEVVRGLLDTSRLLTLTGMGGTGKTRLALQVATEVMSQYSGGVWLVALAAVADPTYVPSALAQVLGVAESARASVAQSVLEALGDRHVLLLLDNCEHLLDAVAELAEHILRSCPQVTVVCTSREPLGLPGEAVYRVPSLGTAVTGAEPALPDAVLLFVDRAQAARPSFGLSGATMERIVEVCRRLDGIPLAIELAAARVGSMSTEQICRGLDQRFSLLTSGSRTALPRHRTLAAMVDWSYNLLDSEERTLLNRMSVFVDGTTLDAAQEVCADLGWAPWACIDRLTGLVSKSLVQFDDQTDRYQLLETVREYAAGKLLDAGEAASCRGHHSRYYLQLAGAVQAASNTDALVPARSWAVEKANYRAALAWLAQEEPACAAELAACLVPAWDHAGDWREGREVLEACLAERASLSQPRRAELAHGCALLCLHLGDYAAARQWAAESMAVGEAEGSPALRASGELLLGRVAEKEGATQEARSRLASALPVLRQAGDHAGVASGLSGLAALAMNEGRWDEAAAALDESLGLLRAIGDAAGVAYTLGDLGNIAQRQGRLNDALAAHGEALASHRRRGDRRGVIVALANYGVAARAAGNLVEARSAYEEGLALARELGQNHAVAVLLANLGEVYLKLGDTPMAERLLLEGCSLCERLGTAVVHSYCLSNLGDLERDAGRVTSAATAYGAALAMRWRAGYRQGYAEILEELALLGRIADQVDPPALASAAAVLRAELGMPRSASEQARLDAADLGNTIAAGAGVVDPHQVVAALVGADPPAT